jgi:hypothetical protein
MNAMEWLSKYWPALVILIAGAGASVATYVSTHRDQEQKDNIENLGKENVRLSKAIEKLDTINNSISTKIEQITTGNTKILNQNVELSQQSRDLITKVHELTDQTKKLIDTINKRAAYESEENAITGELQFKGSPIFKEDDPISIVFGGMTMGNSLKLWKNGAKALGVNGKNPLKMEVEGNKILFSLNVYDIDGNLVAEIDKNNWRPNKNFTGKFNYDNSSFEVVDNKGRLAINIQYSGKDIIINGMFPFTNDGIIFLAGSEGTEGFPMHVPGHDQIPYKGKQVNYFQLLDSEIERLGIKKIFKYTGKNWLHQRL